MQNDTTPAVSLIVPFRNAERHLASMLESILSQADNVDMELILVDNGSQDGSRAIAERCLGRAEVRIVDAHGKANASYARNVGVDAARAAKLMFVDADDVLAPGYIAALSLALDEHDFVTSRVDSTSLNAPWLQGAHGPFWQDASVSVFFGFMVATGVNIGIRRELFRKIGGFPEAFAASQDIVFSWNAQRAGATVFFVPEAVYRYRYRDTLSGLYRQSRNWGRSNVLLFRTFRGVGMARRPVRRVAKDWLSVIRGLLFVWKPAERARSVVRLGSCIGRLQGCFRYRALYL